MKVTRDTKRDTNWRLPVRLRGSKRSLSREASLVEGVVHAGRRPSKTATRFDSRRPLHRPYQARRRPLPIIVDVVEAVRAVYVLLRDRDQCVGRTIVVLVVGLS
jgi:hypothetical protein